MTRELMTGYLGPGTGVLSELTVGALDDMGYTVDYNTAVQVGDSVDGQPFDPTVEFSCCTGRRRNLRATDPSVRLLQGNNGNGQGNGNGNGNGNPPLSPPGLSNAKNYGKQVLAEAKANGPSERIEGGAAFVGDLLTTVYYEEDGNLYGVDVFADGF